MINTETKKEVQNTIRKLREKECFKIVDRSKLWYSELTSQQLSELKRWYHAWLDAPATLKIPKAPVWLNDKPIKEDII